MADFRLGRADLRPESRDFRCGRADFKPEKAYFRLERLDGGTNGWTD